MNDSQRMLHLLRNPWGHSEDDVRRARLWAADRIEQFEREEARGVGVCPGCGSPECPGKPEPHSAPNATRPSRREVDE